MNSEINLVVAHALEARPLIEWFGLSRVRPQGHFPCFTDDAGLVLIITGMGAENAAAGVDWLNGQQPAGHRAWLNIGIAGHGRARVGEGLLINRIEHQASGDRFWPPVPDLKLSGSGLITVDKPETAYAKDVAYDMEAAAFYAAASRLTPSDLVHVFKIVSDNREHPLAGLNLKEVPGLISGQQSAIRLLADHLRERSARLADWHSLPPEFRLLLGKYHFSATRKAALAKACCRFRALGKQQQLTGLAQARYRDAASLMATLEAALAAPDGEP